ncbi:MAG TPA: hypothetical protein VMB50_17725 [Myxococcales bacterium]|nr:hypothetical protein [Myxococcales bacterium]
MNHHGDAAQKAKRPTTGTSLLVATSCLLAALCTCAAQARADGPLEDTVTLRNGAIYSGQIVEKVPGDHETLKLATGRIQRIAWSDIVQLPPRQPSTLGGTFPSFQSIEMLAVPPAERVLVRLDSDNPHATLEQLTGQQVVYEGHGATGVVDFSNTVCTAPCGLDLGRTLMGQPLSYRVGGDGVATSDWFSLPDSPGQLELHAKTGSAAGKTWGQVLTWAGAGVAGLGGAALLAGEASRITPPAPPAGCPTCSEPNNDASNAFIAAGVGMLIGGAVMLAAGIPLWVLNRTTVTVEGGDRLAEDDSEGSSPSTVRWTPAGFAF